MQVLLKDLRVWLNATARWLASAWRVWSALVVVAIIVLSSMLLPGSIEDSIRYSGLILQLLGVATVVAVLRDKRRVFNRPSLFDYFKSWLASRPQFRPKPQVISLSGIEAAFVMGGASISTWRGYAENATLEERVATIEANLESLRKDQAAERKRARDEGAKVTTAIESERAAREAADIAIREKVEAFGAGGLHIEATGLFWLILGIVLATIPAEIARLLSLTT